MSTQAFVQPNTEAHVTEKRKSATIRFAGDSGDGMQITGAQFTTTAGVAGNDLMTFPDFPAEIRAPAGTLAGVSGFQVHFSSDDIYTPGDAVDVLIAMNPAALQANIKDLRQNGILIVNADAFSDKNLSRLGTVNPLDDESLKSKFRIISSPISTLTKTALEEFKMTPASVERCKNFFALGITYFMFMRNPETTYSWIENRFKGKDTLIAANKKALNAGFSYAETVEAFYHRYEIPAGNFEPGLYRNITGNSALALGLVAASKLADLPLVAAAYPITPASDILHQLSGYKNYGVKTFQAEDEIAAAGAALGAVYGGSLGVTMSSGPGITLKMEAVNLAVMTELPLLIVDVQRAGPSTGMPTKVEQGDLLELLFGRNSESPVIIVSAYSPSDCFDVAIEAVRLALKFMTPVFLMSDAYLANGSEPWKVPSLIDLKKIDTTKITSEDSPADFKVLKRDPNTMARRWPVPGIPGFEHRVGGLEKHSLTGHISYDPDNHQEMIETRARKVANVANHIPEQAIHGDQSGDLLVLSWGSTYGAVFTAVNQARSEGKKVSHAHMRYLNPMPRNIGDILKNFKKVLIPELNSGQLAMLIRARFLVNAEQLNKIKGRPFLISEVKAKIDELC